MLRREFLATTATALALPVVRAAAAAASRHLLYIAEPGIRNYQQYGGIGVLVYDIDDGYKFVKRIPTWTARAGPGAGERQGRGGQRRHRQAVRQHDQAHRLHRSRHREDDLGARARRRVRPDGALAGRQGHVRARRSKRPALERRQRADGRSDWRRSSPTRARTTRCIRATGNRSTSPACGRPLLSVADPKTHTVVRTVGPFANSIRPFTVNGARTLCYVNCNELLGFEIGDLRTGQETAPRRSAGLREGPGDAARLSESRRRPDAGRKEALALRRPQQRDAHLRQHRDAAEADRISLKVRDQPGWITFTHRRQARVSVDGRGLRHEDQEDGQGPAGRDGARDRQRKAARDHRGRHEAGPGRRPVRRRQKAIAPAHGRDTEAGAPATPPRRAPQPSLVRRAGRSRVRPPIAHGADGLRPLATTPASRSSRSSTPGATSIPVTRTSSSGSRR